MRYMIAHMIGGDARAYHENLSRVLASVYKLRPVTASIDPHLTIKAPFDALSTDLYDVELLVERFVRGKSPLPYTLKGFGKFDDRVVYMNAEVSEDTLSFMRELKDELRQVPWLEFKSHEDDLKPHATLCYPRSASVADEILARLTEKGGREFHGTVDSLALLKKGDRRWEIHKQYRLGSSDGDTLSSISV